MELKKYKKTVHLLAQSYTPEQYEKLGKDLFGKKPSVMFSADDAVGLINLPDATDDSEVVVYGDWDSGDIVGWLKDRGVNNVVVHEKTPENHPHSWFWVDLNQYQPSGVDWEELSRICGGVILKATEGTEHVDELFVSRLRKANENGLLVDVFHSLRLGQDINKQAQHFFNNIAPYLSSINSIWINSEQWKVSSNTGNVSDIFSVDDLLLFRSDLVSLLKDVGVDAEGMLGWFTANYWLNEVRRFYSGSRGDISRLNDHDMKWWLAGYINMDSSWESMNGVPVQPDPQRYPVLRPTWLKNYDLWQFAIVGDVRGIPTSNIGMNLRMSDIDIPIPPVPTVATPDPTPDPTPIPPHPTVVPVEPDPTPIPPHPTVVPVEPDPTPIPPHPTVVPVEPDPTPIPPHPTVVPVKPDPTPVPPHRPFPLQSAVVKRGISVPRFAMKRYGLIVPLYQQIRPTLLRIPSNSRLGVARELAKSFPNATLVVSTNGNNLSNLNTIMGIFEDHQIIVEIAPNWPIDSTFSEWLRNSTRELRQAGIKNHISVRVSNNDSQIIEEIVSLYKQEICDAITIVSSVSNQSDITSLTSWVSEYDSVIPVMIDITAQNGTLLASCETQLRDTSAYTVMLGNDWTPNELNLFSPPASSRPLAINLGHPEETGIVETKYPGETVRLLQPFSVSRYMESAKINDATAATIEQYTRHDDNWVFPGKGVWGEQYRMPLSEIIRYSIETNSRPWLCVPHRASKKLMQHIAETIFAGLPPHLRPIFEWSNEIWNFNFAQRGYATEKWWKEDSPEWQKPLLYQAAMTKLLYEIVDGRGDVALCIQATDPNHGRLFVDTLQVQDYVDAYAIAPYFGQFTTVSSTSDPLVDLLANDINTRVRPLCIEHKQIADRGNLPLWAYEAGQHVVGRNETATNLFQSLNRSGSMRMLHKMYEDMWHEIGGGMFCWFHLYGGYTNQMFGMSELTKDHDLIMHPKSFVFTGSGF